jgi:hypothetical protein
VYIDDPGDLWKVFVFTSIPRLAVVKTAQYPSLCLDRTDHDLADRFVCDAVLF